MDIHYGYENLQLEKPVVTLGIFDGVHLGHRILLDRLVRCAGESGGDSVVITFSPHPRIVLEKDNRSIFFLTTMEEKQALLEKAGIGHLIVLDFNREFSNTGACDFIRDVLVEKIGTRHLIIGFNHHFGRKGEGDYNTVSECAEAMGFLVERVEGLYRGEMAISSSLVREALMSGRLEDANQMLGYPYSLKGIVVEGRRIGRSIGFPTANIEPVDVHKLVPYRGVYAVEVILGGSHYRGMLSIGSNPTVNRDERLKSIEVHIIGFSEEIYGMEITIIFRKRLRDEKKFGSLRELTSQMELDKRFTIDLFDKE